jgi:hypothetical protein
MITETPETDDCARTYRRNRGAHSQYAATGRDTAETVRATLRVIAGIAVLIALMAVATAAIGAGASE